MVSSLVLLYIPIAIVSYKTEENLWEIEEMKKTGESGTHNHNTLEFAGLSLRDVTAK